MRELILTVGLPASGKTTWVNEFLKNNPNYFNINRDDLRLMFQGRARYNKFSKQREAMVSGAQLGIAIDAVAHDKSIIVSDTNLNPSTMKKWEKFADDNNLQFTLKQFTDVPLKTCIERDAKREFPVSAKVIMSMFDRYQDIYWPKKYTGTPNQPKTIVCDLDGTAALMHERKPYEWDKVSLDKVNYSVYNIILGLNTQQFTIVYLSGRDGSCYDDTLDWLTINNFPRGKLFMRAPNDSRKDYIIKEEIFFSKISDNYDVKFMIDDRPQVCHHWRQLGLEVIQIGNPLNDF